MKGLPPLDWSSADMSNRQFIFQDQDGKRWPRLRLAGWILAVLGIAALGLFFTSLFMPVDLPALRDFAELKKQLQAANPAPTIRATDLALQKFLAANHPPRLQPIRPRKAIDANAPIHAAFVDNWNANSLNSLRNHAHQLTHLIPEWLTLISLDGTLTEIEEANLEQFASLAPIILMPTLSNLNGNDWQPEAVESLALAPKSKRQAFARHLVTLLQSVKAGGVVIDWQKMDPTYRPQLSRLINETAAILHEQKLQLWLSVSMSGEMNVFDLDAVADQVDHFVAILQDETTDTDAPGPVASQNWFEGWLSVLMRHGKPEQWIAAIGNYGYDWAANSSKAERLSFADVMSRADHAAVQSAESRAPDDNPTYSYDQKSIAHTVWFLDAVTFLNQYRAALDSGLGGFALDQLGNEDPGVWKAISLAEMPTLTPEALGKLAVLKGDATITSVGQGGVVSVQMEIADGSRQLTLNPDGPLSETYRDFPSYPTLYREGAGDGKSVTLTFDDGPDPEWTPPILDLLKARGIKATFFLIGRSAEEHPDLVQRIVAEGHEIGGHSFTHANLAVATPAQIRLELNVTQRLLESLTGRSTYLFRPPYNADSQPTELADLSAIEIAGGLHYLTVLEDVDPQDWAKPSAETIVERVKTLRAGGNIILLHDGGGDRTQTLAALPKILDYLDARGDRVVPLSELLGMTRDDLNPPLDPKKNTPAYYTSGIGFDVARWLEDFLWLFLAFATVLVTVRSAIILWLAFQNLRRPLEAAPPFFPPLSILIPAHNEGKVIAQTIRSVLRTDYPGEIEVIVVDDGSNDDTLAQAKAIPDPRVKVIYQPNGGKATALQTALATAQHNVLILLDADTQFLSDTLEALVKPLADAKIGAVSGHARVGNRRSFVARCQDLEYVCGFNLDRRAYAEWNCITVVPGAVSAFRREAIVAAGGFNADTLAEDTDLTLAIHRAGYRLTYAPEAVALTEAPETLRTLAKQRFRWAYGTLQCLWKHRDLTFHRDHKALAWFSLPGVWFFQFLLVALAPLIDVLLVQSLIFGQSLAILPYFLIFLTIDLIVALIACHLEGLPYREALRILPMRFLYRPLLSYVVWKAIFKALQGAVVGWGKLHRTASVTAQS